MSSEAFGKCLNFTLQWEGGYVDHPADPGGKTNFGVTDRTYRAWRTSHHLPQRDVRLIERREVEQIYRGGYWNEIQGDQLRVPLVLALFDFAVNSGPTTAVKALQGLLGVQRDGIIGPTTLEAILGRPQRTLALKLVESRRALFQRLAARRPEMAVFLVGWRNRCDALEDQILV